MVSGDIMPPMPFILAATIGVTFVGPKNLPEQTMTGFLCVNKLSPCLPCPGMAKIEQPHL